ncbi:phosphoadenylyl-sulfate reductase [Marivibrio halodurans]|uniref:Adenosine 5'-phosphosulfate reductase n=1 Tax=Marivibrio halodurans TaxID=2039722 RepID=A0A8J7S567_9PROT|nr:phosphoadenylyl-sulfate reductase [Marivibrio halodurans]MBP5859004.1 phosphoadenylyl-sulfate reductase [Marivibrio halodurans]
MTRLARPTDGDPSTLYRAFETLSGLEGLDLLSKSMLEVLPTRVVTVSSFGAESAVLLDLVARVDPDAPVYFIDTGMHFPETLAYRDLLIDRLRLTNVINLGPDGQERAAEDPEDLLHRSDIDGCCDLRKVRPLDRALAGAPAWISGRKRFQGGARTTLQSVEWEETPEGGRRLKLNPLASWREADIDAYFDNYALPRHPLWEDGYPSVGCAPCTAKPDPDATDRRAGRWAGLGKTECGIHNRRKPATSPIA